MSDSILDRELILVAGKGGVGRSTVAAAIAAATARRGRRTLLLEANAKDRYGTFFDAKTAVGPSIVRLRPRLHAVNTTPAACLEEYGMMILRFRRIYRMVFENRITKHFLRAIPGLDDYSILGKVWFHTTEREWDTVVFDLPASGHSVSLLRVPKTISTTVPEGPLTRDARKILALLSDNQRTALTIVTLAEEMAATEAAELAQTLSTQLQLQPAQLVINQLFPARLERTATTTRIVESLAACPTLPPDLAALSSHATLALSRRRLNQHYVDTLKSTVDAPQTHLPFVFHPSFGPREIDTLSAIIERSW